MGDDTVDGEFVLVKLDGDQLLDNNGAVITYVNDDQRRNLVRINDYKGQMPVQELAELSRAGMTAKDMVKLREAGLI